MLKANEYPLNRVGQRELKLLFVVNVDWFFLSHRLSLAKAAKRAGYEVIVAAAESGQGDRIRQEGFAYRSIPISRKGMNPLYEIKSMGSLLRLYRELRPDLVHQFTIKPVLYGSVAARFAGYPAVVNSITGLGYTFTRNRKARLLKRFARVAYAAALHYPFGTTIFQHDEDCRELVEMKLVSERQTVVIPGSGVDCSEFRPLPEPDGVPIVMLPSRMLWDKGVGTFVKAAGMLCTGLPRVRCVLVGRLDESNPSAISDQQVRHWVEEGVVEWWGYRNDMPHVLSRAAVVVLPSVREGVPKVLLEAAASARAIVAGKWSDTA